MADEVQNRSELKGTGTSSFPLTACARGWLRIGAGRRAASGSLRACVRWLCVCACVALVVRHSFATYQLAPTSRPRRAVFASSLDAVVTSDVKH